MNDRRFNPSQAHRLDAPERQLWLPSAEVVDALDIRAGDTIADIGAGTGYFSVPLAMAVGTRGKVYAIDAQAEMLALLQQKLHNKAALNITPIQAEADTTGLPGACCTLAFLANVWHEFADRAAVLGEVRRILGAGGRVAILDWRPDVERNAGPPIEHRLRAVDAQEELRLAGFSQTTVANVGQYSWLVQGRILP